MKGAVTMQKEELVVRLCDKLTKELKIWCSQQCYFSGVYQILQQYSAQYIYRQNLIECVKNSGMSLDNDILMFLLNDTNSLEFLVKAKIRLFEPKKRENCLTKSSK